MPELATAAELPKLVLSPPALIPTLTAVTGPETDSAPTVSIPLPRRDNTVHVLAHSAKKTMNTNHVPQDDRPNDQSFLILTLNKTRVLEK